MMSRRVLEIKVRLIETERGALLVDTQVHALARQTVVNQQEFHPDDFKSNFDRIWDSIGSNLKTYCLEKEKQLSKAAIC